MRNKKRIVTLILSACLLFVMTGCGKISCEEAFSKVGVDPIDSGTLYSSTEKVSKLDKSQSDIASNMTLFRYIYDDEDDCISEAAEYGFYLMDEGWEPEERPNGSDNSIYYISEDNDAEISLTLVGPLSGDYEKEGFGGKYAIFVAIYYNE